VARPTSLPVAAPEPVAPAVLPAVKTDPADVAKQVEGNTAFALDLYAKLATDKEFAGKNLFFSPYSISSALAMTYAGARANTAAEMKKTLHFALEDEKLHAAFASLTGGLNAGDPKTRGYQLAVANALWGQKGYKFLDPFIKLNKDLYGAGLNDVDFVGDTEGARKIINVWVEKQTQDKIKELLKPGVLDKLTRLVLTNAIYFKGDWARQFDKKRTMDQDFTVSATETVKVPTMYQSHDFRLVAGSFSGGQVAPDRGGWPEEADEKAAKPDFQAIELPYRGNELSMVVLLPGKKDGIAELEKALTGENLGKWLAGLDKAPKARGVVVFLPKFKVTAELKANDVLVSMGMADAFKKRIADFSLMNGIAPPDDGSLYISAVIHKAFVDVNEEGTEAAAATAVVVTMVDSAAPPPLMFKADHPFVFLIRDNRTKSVLFMGRMVNPKQP
jgi:serpin B